LNPHRRGKKDGVGRIGKILKKQPAGISFLLGGGIIAGPEALGGKEKRKENAVQVH